MRIRFQQTFGAHTGRTLAFDKDLIRFGRLPDCDMAFDPQADLDASGRHAEVRFEQGRWWVVDVGSRNGTLVNGQRITRAPLNPGDEIEFGPGGPRVRVEIAASPAAPPAPPAPPWGGGAVRPDAATAAATPVVMQSAAASAMGPAVGVIDLPAAHPPSPRDFTGPMTPARPMPPGMAPPSMGPEAGGAPPKVGQKTVAMMIEHALAHARQSTAGGGNRSTAFLRAIASEAAHHSSRRLKIALTIVTVLLVMALVAIVVLVVQTKQESSSARDEAVRLQAQLADLGSSDAQRRQELEARIAELNRQLEQQARGVGPHIAAANARSLFLFVVRTPDGRERAICSGFAVRPDLLATNAHCVLGMEQERMRGALVEALPNGAGGQRLAVLQMWRHPAYVQRAEHPTPDIGLVQVNGAVLAVVTLATMDQLARLAPGDDVFVYGFPGNISLTVAPVATITNGVVGRMTSFDGRSTDPAVAQLLQHSAQTSAGTSGSPIFDRAGVVVGINAGAFRSPQEQVVVDRGGPHAQMVLAESGYKYGVRADLLVGLLAGMGR